MDDPAVITEAPLRRCVALAVSDDDAAMLNTWLLPGCGFAMMAADAWRCTEACAVSDESTTMFAEATWLGIWICVSYDLAGPDPGARHNRRRSDDRERQNERRKS